MPDDILRYHGGPKDGDIVELPPDWGPTKIDQLEGMILPNRIQLVDGGLYTFSPETKRYEWVG
jgi:hypothetical protein